MEYGTGTIEIFVDHAGSRYLLTITDNYSEKSFDYFPKNKIETFSKSYQWKLNVKMKHSNG